MATHALRVWPVEENLFAFGGIATKECLPIFGQRIVVRAKGVIIRQLFFHRGGLAFGGGIQQVELQFLGDFAGHQIIEPPRENIVSGGILEAAEDDQGGLFFAQGSIFQCHL